MSEVLIKYKCPQCGYTWCGVWSCACDSECDNCGAKNIQALEWEDIDTVSSNDYQQQQSDDLSARE